MSAERRPTTWRQTHAILMPEEPNKDEKSRLGYFIDWMARSGRAWYQPDLAQYRDYLLKDRVRYDQSGAAIPAPLSPSTVTAHLATIRGRYDQLTRDNRLRDMLYDLTSRDASPADRKAMVDEMFIRLQNAVHPSSAQVKTIDKQDIADSEHLRLKPYQVQSLLKSPGISTLRGLRDTAMIALMVCTGVRAAELSNLRVEDIRQSLGDELSLMVRRGKGSKQRLIPYGPLDWCLRYVDGWLKKAQITGGYIFRGILKDGKTVRKTGIGTWTVNDVMLAYPIMIDGDLRDVKPHDLRRTYARNAYEFGMDLERIRQNLGHTSLQTTQTYIGELNAIERHPPNMFKPPHDNYTLDLLING